MSGYANKVKKDLEEMQLECQFYKRIKEDVIEQITKASILLSKIENNLIDAEDECSRLYKIWEDLKKEEEPWRYEED